MDQLNQLKKLDDIAGPLLGLSKDIARRRHALGLLPLPSFRMDDKRKGPIYVHEDDIAALIEKRRAGAKKLHNQMESVA